MSDLIDSVDRLRAMCVVYEASYRDAMGSSLNQWWEVGSVAGTTQAGPEEDDQPPDVARCHRQ